MNTSVPFSRDYAAVYDVVYKEKPYESEVDLVMDLSTEALGYPPRNVVDVACRTGRHLVLFAGRGCYVHGNDLSAAMVERAQSRLQERGCKNFQLSCDPMPVIDARAPYSDGFDLAVALDTSTGYLTEDSFLSQFLKNVMRLLRPGGCFFADVWNGLKVPKDFERHREKTVEDEQFWVRRLSRVTHIPSEHLLNVEFEFMTRQKARNEARVFWESHCARYHTPSSLRRLLLSHRFENVSVGPFFPQGATLEDCWHFYVFGQTPSTRPSLLQTRGGGAYPITGFSKSTQ